jgi:TolA-binding protein
MRTALSDRLSYLDSAALMWYLSLMRMRFYQFLVVFLLLPCTLPAQDSKENSDFKLAVSLYNDKMYDLALEQFKQFTNLFPNSTQSIEARYYIALTQLKLKKFDDARYSFQNFALSYPDNVKTPDAWMNVAEVYLALNNLPEAALAFERVKTFNPKSKQAPGALLKAAEYYQKAGDREDAKRVLRILTQEYSDPDVILPGYLQYASLLMGDRDYEGVRTACKKVIEATKDPVLRPQALLLSADALWRLERFREAETLLNEIITNFRLSPGYFQSLLLLGSLKKEAGDFAAAISTWKTLVADSVRTPRQVLQDALMSLGEAGTLNGEFQKSLEYFERAGGILVARSGEAWFRAGEMAERTRNTGKMAEYYGRAVKDTASVIDRRTILIGGIKGAASERDYLESVRLADEYRTKYPEDANLPRIMFESADICTDELKDYHKAIGLYNEILAKFPQSTYVDDALYGLGITLRLSGQFDESIRILESLEKRFPGSDLIDGARSEAQFIRLFDFKNKESGFEKLALLVGDVIAQQSKGDLAFRLAEIYFHELLDFRQAVAQYRFALTAGLESDGRPDAWFNLARSFEYLNLRDRRLKDGESATKDAVSAIAAYDSLLMEYPERPYAVDAALAQLNLKIQLTPTAAGLRKLGANLLSSAPFGRYKDRGLLALGNAYLTAKDPEDATLAFKSIVDQSSQSESAPEALFQFGKALMRLADRDSAAVVLNAFLERHPNHQRCAEAAALLAQYESEKGKADRANSLYDLLEKKYYYTAFATNLHRKRGDAYFTAGDYSKAVESYKRQILQIHSDYFANDEIPTDLLYNVGYSCEKLGNSTEAKRYFSQYVRRVTESEKLGSVYYSLASIARGENNTELAGRFLQEAIRHTPASSDEGSQLSLEAAELLFNDGHYVDAIARYGEVAQQTKKDGLREYLQARIAVCYFRLDNIKEADKRSLAFLKEHPKNETFAAEFEFERGRYLLRKDDSGKALARFENVVRQYKETPVVPEALFWTGRTLELSEKPHEAIALYDSVVKYYPRSSIVPQAELSLGNVYYNLEQWDSAAHYYKTIVDSASRSPDLLKYAMNNLAMTYKRLKLYDAAMELDRAYIERFPDDTDIVEKKIDIAVLYQDLGYYDQSAVQLQSLLELGNASIEAELRYYMGEAYYYKGNYQQAILEFLKVPYLVSKRGKADWISTSYYMAGQSYEKMSKFDLAMAMYKKIIDSRDTDTEFKTAAQREIDRVRILLSK